VSHRRLLLSELHIKAGKAEAQYWKDIWRYRELFLIFTWRDVTVRYKQTLIGISWAIIRPLLMMLAFTFIFEKVAKLPSEGEIPYALMVYVALLPWQLFSTCLTASSSSLVINSNLISKIYFPRILVPASTIGVALVDFSMSCGVLSLLMWWYKFIPTFQIFLIIPLTLLCAALALGPGLLLCSLNVTYRDFKIILPFITQFGLYLSPVGFSSSAVPDKWYWLFMCNPIVGLIDGYRWAVLDSVKFPGLSLLMSFAFALIFIYLGLRVFRRTERTFSDII
jgi:lipopolysaccharide transport system permease protein